MAATSEDTAQLLRHVSLFSALADEDLAQVAELAVPRTFGAGEVVFREGDASDTCYVLRAGHARAVLEHPDGRSITLAQFGPGEIFGELAMLGGSRARQRSKRSRTPRRSRSSDRTCGVCCASTRRSRSS
jgi:CRP/FNR family transcriptional regulator